MLHTLQYVIRRFSMEKIKNVLEKAGFDYAVAIATDAEIKAQAACGQKAAEILREKYPNVHIYVSTVGIKGTDFSWIEGNITLQISLHSFDEKQRDWLIPITNKMTLEELGQIRTKSNLKTTINMTLVNESDFDIEKLQKYFDKDYFFIKLSPINKNATSEMNNMGDGIIEGINLV